MYVNAARPHIIRVPAPRENNKLKFNAAIISIYGTLKAAAGVEGDAGDGRGCFLWDVWAKPVTSHRRARSHLRGEPSAATLEGVLGLLPGGVPRGGASLATTAISGHVSVTLRL